MPEQMRPASKEQAPDPANTYERSDPNREAGAGRLTNNMNATPINKPDKMPEAVTNQQPGHIQVNGQQSATLPKQPDHSMLEEEPLGWDQAPTDISNPEDKRHPRTGGKGGTPNPGEPDRDG